MTLLNTQRNLRGVVDDVLELRRHGLRERADEVHVEHLHKHLHRNILP